MKLHFEPNLDYQHAAIESVCDLFKGQEICRSVFTVTRDSNDAQQRMGFAENDIGIGNRLTLLDDDLLILIRFQDETNNARYLAWQDHVESIGSS